jgi:hypothetical protein
MDGKSHELFAGILLDAAGAGNIRVPPAWGVAPDIDTPFLHRWYRHRISVLPEIYSEFLQANLGSLSNPEADGTDTKDAVALCVVSHLYLDIFNGWVFPFGFFYPLYPEKTIVAGVLDDINNPKLLVKELTKLASGMDAYSTQFYNDSKNLMAALVPDNAMMEDIIAHLVTRLAWYAYPNIASSIYREAMQQISDFTGNVKYTDFQADAKFTDSVCSYFETEYCRLINKAIEE